MAVKVEADLDIQKYNAKLREMVENARKEGRRLSSMREGFSDMPSSWGREMGRRNWQARRGLAGGGAGGPGSAAGAGMLASLGPAALAAAAAYKVAEFSMDSFEAKLEREAMLAGLATNSTEDLTLQVARLREMAKRPGLDFEELVKGSTNLQAVGLNARLAERLLGGFGNALASVGKGAPELGGVATALSQISSKGSVQAEEINQIAERVPQIRALLQEAFGTADTEVIQGMGLETTQFFEGLAGALEKLPQAAETTKNALENQAEAVRELKVQWGELIAQIRTAERIGAVTGIVERLAEVAEFSRKGKEMILEDMATQQRANIAKLQEAAAAQEKAAEDARWAGLEHLRPRRPAPEPTKEELDAREKLNERALSIQDRMEARRIGALPAEEQLPALEKALSGMLSRALEGTGLEGMDGLQRMIDGLNSDHGRERQVALLEVLDEAEQMERRIAKLREDSVKDLEGLRDEVQANAFKLLSPEEQAAQLRGELSRSLGIDIQGAADVERGLRELQREARDAAARGDADAERSALERLKAAQEEAAQLAQLDRGGAGSGGRGGELAPGLGETARALNLIFGRPAGDSALLGEAKVQTGLFRSMDAVLKRIDTRLSVGREEDIFVPFP